MKRKLVFISIKFPTIALVAALFLVLFLNISTLWSVGEIKRGEFITSGYFCAIIGSGSMEPTVAVNDLLLVKGDVSYQVEDIITYVSPHGSLVTHRIKELTDNGYITQGDANNIPDEEIPKQRVLGKVVFVLPGFGGIIDAIISPVGAVLLACIFLLIVLIQRLRNNQIEDEDEEDKQKININQPKQKFFTALSVLVLIFFSFGMIQLTIGKFVHFSTLTDSAIVAEFDIIITAPEEFSLEQSEDIFEYHFLSDTDILGLDFWVINNGEVDILCRPYINNDVIYSIYVAENKCTEFIVAANEIVNFWLVIASDGLDTNVKDAELFIDIQQIEGR